MFQRFQTLPPFDDVSKRKQTLERLRIIFSLAGMIVVFVYFIVIDTRNPFTSLTQVDPGEYVQGDSSTHFTLPDTYFCIQTSDYVYGMNSTEKGFRVTYTPDSWDLTKYDAKDDILTSSDSSYYNSESESGDSVENSNDGDVSQQKRSIENFEQKVHSRKSFPQRVPVKSEKNLRDDSSSSSSYSSDSPPLSPGPKMIFGDQPNVDFFTSYSDFYQCIHIVSDGNYFVSNLGEFWEFNLYWTISWEKSKSTTDNALEQFQKMPFYVYTNYDSTETVDIIAGTAYQAMKITKSATVQGNDVTPSYDAQYLLQFFTPIESTECDNNEEDNSLCAFASFSIDYGVSQFTVQTLTKEDTAGLAKRIITDTGSLTGIIGMIALVIFSEFIARLVLPPEDKTNFIPQQTREAVLHLVNNHRTATEMKSNPIHSSNLNSIVVKPI